MYGQINYSQRLGTGPYTIADAGCFLVSFSNLLTRMGLPIDPPTLNNYFIQHGSFVDVDGDRTMDDLGWGTVSSYNSEVLAVKIGGAGWPDGNDAIVKFVYKSTRTNTLVTHFCLVADHTNGTIVDSWDGVTKKSPYGTPVAWARYERHQAQVVSPPVPVASPAFTVEDIPDKMYKLKRETHLWDLNQRTWPGLTNNPVSATSNGTPFLARAVAHHALGGSYYMPDPNLPQGYNIVDCEVDDTPAPVVTPTPVPVNPAPAPPQGGINLPSGKKYTVVVSLSGYLTATMAAQHNKPVSTVMPGEYFVFNIYPNRTDLINVTKIDGKAGSWINTADNVQPSAPAPEPTPAPEPVPTPVPEAPAAATWDKNYKPFGQPDGSLVPIKYVALKPYNVTDFNNVGQPVHLNQYDYIYIAGTFTGPDGLIYGRPQDAVIHSGGDKEYWYGVPMDETLLEPYDELFSAQTTREDRQILKTESLADHAADMLDAIKKLFAKLVAGLKK